MHKLNTPKVVYTLSVQLNNNVSCEVKSMNTHSYLNGIQFMIAQRVITDLHRGKSNLCPLFRKTITSELWRNVGKRWLRQLL